MMMRQFTRRVVRETGTRGFRATRARAVQTVGSWTWHEDFSNIVKGVMLWAIINVQEADAYEGDTSETWSVKLHRIIITRTESTNTIVIDGSSTRIFLGIPISSPQMYHPSGTDGFIT